MKFDYKSPAFILVVLYFSIPRLFILISFFFLPDFNKVLSDPVYYGFGGLLVPYAFSSACLITLFGGWNIITAAVFLVFLAFDFLYLIPRGNS